MRLVLLRCGGEEAWGLQHGSGAEPQQRGERATERVGADGAEMGCGGKGKEGKVRLARPGCEALPQCLFRHALPRLSRAGHVSLQVEKPSVANHRLRASPVLSFSGLNIAFTLYRMSRML